MPENLWSSTYHVIRGNVPFSAEYYSDGGAVVRGVSLELPACRSPAGGARSADRPRDSPALRDEEAARRLLKKAIRRHDVPAQSTINGRAAHEAAIKSSKAAPGTASAIRKSKSLNNIVAQDHRGVTRITRPMVGFKSFDVAPSTLVGIALMHMLRT